MNFDLQDPLCMCQKEKEEGDYNTMEVSSLALSKTEIDMRTK